MPVLSANAASSVRRKCLDWLLIVGRPLSVRYCSLQALAAARIAVLITPWLAASPGVEEPDDVPGVANDLFESVQEAHQCSLAASACWKWISPARTPRTSRRRQSPERGAAISSRHLWPIPAWPEPSPRRAAWRRSRQARPGAVRTRTGPASTAAHCCCRRHLETRRPARQQRQQATHPPRSVPSRRSDWEQRRSPPAWSRLPDPNWAMALGLIWIPAG